MLGIYLLFLLIFAVTVIYKVKTLSQNKGNVLLSKTDTEFLRGISACFVIIAHSCIWINEMMEGDKVLYFVISQLGGIGVLIFFFVSGYGIYEKYAHKHPS